MVLINKNDKNGRNLEVQFPSPCGDYGSYQHFPLRMSKKVIVKFPSPCGDYGSYQVHREHVALKYAGVSVPLRGLWFLSHPARYPDGRCGQRFPSPCGDYGSYLLGQGADNDASPHRVSVPLRGLWFLSKWGRPHVFAPAHEFPSPCGDYGSYLCIEKINAAKAASRFRPLAGIMVLIIETEFDVYDGVGRRFPSPCGDYGSYHASVSGALISM